jgi:lysophospholipid acyltransferase (LPLAT)-like uncharacterized protein
MRLLRRFLASEFGQRLAASFVASYIRAVYRVNRWTRRGYDKVDSILLGDRRAIFCFWHGRLLMMPFAMKGERTFHVLISGHRDGRLIAHTVQRFGARIIFGSSYRRPIQALRSAARICKQGGLVGITPDGPRGPRMRAAPGAVMAAELAGAVLVPVGYATSRRRLLPSWDRFLLPLPFGRGAIVIGDPIEVPPRLDSAGREVLRLELERALNGVTAEADRLTGNPPVEPAPPA